MGFVAGRLIWDEDGKRPVLASASGRVWLFRDNIPLQAFDRVWIVPKFKVTHAKRTVFLFKSCTRAAFLQPMGCTHDHTISHTANSIYPLLPVDLRECTAAARHGRALAGDGDKMDAIFLGSILHLIHASPLPNVLLVIFTAGYGSCTCITKRRVCHGRGRT